MDSGEGFNRCEKVGERERVGERGWVREGG